MTFNKYIVGQLVILKNHDSSSGGFKNSLGVLVDPPTILCRVRNPLGVEVVYTFGIDARIEKLAVGRYRCTIKPLLFGWWSYKWEAIDAAAAIVVALEGADERMFYIERSFFPVAA